MPSRTWHLHGSLNACSDFGYRGTPPDHAEAQRLAAALTQARLAFRRATSEGDFGAAIAAELAWSAHESALRPVMTRLRRPDRRPFTPEEIDAALVGFRRLADVNFDYVLAGKIHGGIRGFISAAG